MAERTLEDRYRLLAASFGDSERGGVWRERLGSDYGDAMGVLILGLGADVAVDPRDLDGQHVGELLETCLPARMSGEETFRGSLPDLLEDLLCEIAVAEGIGSTFEFVNGVGSARSAFDRALDDPDRVRYAAPKQEPDRRPAAKIGRNDPCPCGSGQKYKKCCLNRL